MRKMNREKLQTKYDFLKPTPITDGLMAFGFDCNDGWLGILADLFEAIDKALPKKERKNFKVMQVKEKFGTLRVYTYGGNDAIDKLIEQAEQKSAITCEFCGKRGAMQTKTAKTAWIRTLCTACRKKHV